MLIRPSALGDVCRTVPVLASLRAAYPNAAIDWLVQDTFVEAIEHHPALRRAVPFDRTGLGRAARRGNLGPALKFMRSLAAEHYDMVIDAQGLGRSALFAWSTRAVRRVGYTNAQEFGWLAYTDRVREPREKHAVDRMLGLLRPLGVGPVRDMRLYPDPQARADVVAEHAEPFAVLAPTSRWAAKRWPVDRFAELARRLLDAGVPKIVVVGAASERAQCRPVLDLAAGSPQVTDRVGSTSIAQLMALISRAKLVVANDSAALHMAVGFDRPTVALFGPTDVSRVGPYRREADVIQHVTPGDPIDHKTDANGALMARISVDEVFDACMARLAQPGG
ncbi:MAG: lipopolysaccharide heptosyltransferase I [Phycisphaeraceae bacterium]|nr:MAG: lipopolysaccharide heptosyltransferase I [Phycisphaeraceae bacterium]